LLDPNGELVAASTSGGTDELIDFSVPAEGGVYTLVVHGWAVGSEELPYALSSWTVPVGATSLVLDSAPTEAVIATTGTVTVSWAGLDAGVSYLGAVAHTDAAGLLARTLVSVET
ncbi:MAG: hypothetical protein ACRDIL_01940, partial [Candidatus Limnocylindrales bacterium]